MKTFILTLLIFIPFSTFANSSPPQPAEEDFKMKEFDTNYFASGKPDTKIQFSFKFRFLKNYNLYGGYTQTLFWDLGKKDSNPFSDINFNPELFYRFEFTNYTFFKALETGYAHLSNGKDGEESRSIDALFVRLINQKAYSFGIPKLHIELRYLMNPDTTNEDIYDYYGPYVIRAFFTKLGKKLFYSEETYLEYYNGGRYGDDFSKSSIRVSLRFKVFKEGAPKIFIQYFNGYGENLKKYNQREETYRIGLSLGGF